MKYIKSFVFLLMAFSCTSPRGFVNVNFNYIESNSNYQNKKKVKIKILKNYVYNGLKAGGEQGECQNYTYSDSSFLYICSMNVGYNEANIKDAGFSSRKLEYKIRQKASPVDTLDLSGKQSGNLYWRVILMGQLEVGYGNVSENSKNLFDYSIQSIFNEKR